MVRAHLKNPTPVVFRAGMPRGIACDGGFRILGTPIGFGGTRGAGLKFLSHIDEPTPNRGSRVLVTPFTAAAIGVQKRGLDALTLGYNRKIRLGRMDIRLFPAGLGFGSAQFEVSFKDRRIVFSAGVRMSQPLACPPLEFPTCDLLLLDAEPAEPRPPSPRRVSMQIKQWVFERISAGQVPVLCAGSLAAALDAAWTLKLLDTKFRATRPLFEMLRRVETAGFSIPHLTRLEQQLPTSSVVLHVAHLWPESRLFREESTTAAYIGPGRNKPKWSKVAFRLGEGEDRPGLISYVKKMGAHQVALGPRCDRATGDMLQKAGIDIYRIQHPKQMPLPF